MYKDILRSIAGVEVFPLVSLGLFIVVFAVVLIWTSRLDGSRLTRLSRLPLDHQDADAAAPPSSDPQSQGVIL